MYEKEYVHLTLSHMHRVYTTGIMLNRIVTIILASLMVTQYVNDTLFHSLVGRCTLSA